MFYNFNCYKMPQLNKCVPNDFFTWVTGLKSLKAKGKNSASKPELYNIVVAFDIETTKVKVNGEDHALMYHWQFSFDNQFVITGRTWNSYHQFRSLLCDICGDVRFLTLVHNLSYEFQFLKGIYNFDSDNIFALDRRKICKCFMPPFDYRCSYIHSGVSLEKYAEDFKSPYQKLVGDIDHNIEHLPNTVLTEKEWNYCVNDVTCLVGAAKNEMLVTGDNVQTFLLTRTGRVRRMVKRVMYPSINYLRNIQPDFDTYWLLYNAFRGGDTHANHWHAGKILEECYSVDFKSSYPTVMLNELYPEDFTPVDLPVATSDRIKILENKRHEKPKKALLMRVRLHNLQLSDPLNGMPYISESKCLLCKNPGRDNGRIMYADVVELCLTDIDFNIISEDYDFDLEILNLMQAPYARLPRKMRNVIIELFRKKTEYQGVVGKEIDYNLAKYDLNSVYGMTVFQPVRPEIVYNDETKEFEYNNDINPVEQLEKFEKYPYCAFQWGVWVAAYARRNLRQIIRLAGERCVYVDTDSVKTIGKMDVSDYNERVITESRVSGAFAKDQSGKTVYMGVLEDDGYYSRFATLGAKKYAYEDKDNNLHVTIAGVNKTEGGKELAKAGGLERFIDVNGDPMIFRAAGGKMVKYNDNPPDDLYYKGYKITSNMVILDSEYTLGVTEDYKRLISMAPNIFEPLK